MGVWLVLANSMLGQKFPDEWAVPADPMVSWEHFEATGGLCQQGNSRKNVPNASDFGLVEG